MKRKPNETFEAYRLRRSEQQKAIKTHLKGSIFFESVKLTLLQTGLAERIASTLYYLKQGSKRIRMVRQTKTIVRLRDERKEKLCRVSW